MTKFLSDQPNFIKPVLKNWGVTIGLIVLLLSILTLVFYFLNFKPKDTGYYLAIFFFVIQVARDLFANRFYEIRFDQDTKQINFLYKSWFFNKKQKSLSFDKAQIVVTKENVKTIHFLNQKTALLKLNAYKDGFSKDTLENICITAEQSHIPISRV